MSEPAPKHTLDATGLACPLPVLKAKRAMREVGDGEILEILATDRGAVKDFQTFCEVTGHTLESWHDAEGVLTFHIRKRP
ncbi:MAG: sulfurtransferase tusA [Rhodospirillaceae bacterium]|nr:sulfurtransferase tusA [Rhodospirillaceae bacterium]